MLSDNVIRLKGMFLMQDFSDFNCMAETCSSSVPRGSLSSLCRREDSATRGTACVRCMTNPSVVNTIYAARSLYWCRGLAGCLDTASDVIDHKVFVS